MIPVNKQQKKGPIENNECPVAIVRRGNITTYEVAFPLSSLGFYQPPVPGSHIAITVAINERDSNVQADPSTCCRFNGTTTEKNPGLMGLLYLCPSASPEHDSGIKIAKKSN